MLVKEFSGDVCKRFIEYARNKSDYFYLSTYIKNKNWFEDDPIMNVILEDKKFTKKQIIYDYSPELLQKIYCEYKNDKRIIDIYIKSLNKYFKIRFKESRGLDDDFRERILSRIKENIIMFQKIDEGDEKLESKRKEWMYNIIDWYRYVEVNKLFLDCYKDNIVGTYTYDYQNLLGRTEKIIKFKINDEIEPLLDEIDSISYNFPPFDFKIICFMNNCRMWFKSDILSKKYNIYCENEEEYNYLKSIGIEFYDNHYIKEKIYIYDEKDEEIGFEYDGEVYKYINKINNEVFEVIKVSNDIV